MKEFFLYIIARLIITALGFVVYTFLLLHRPDYLITLFYITTAEQLLAHITPVNGLALNRDGYPFYFALLGLVTLPVLGVASVGIMLILASDAYINVNTKHAYLFHTVSLLILYTSLLFMNPTVAYFLYGVSKFIIAMPSFTIHYSFSAHKHLYVAQLASYAEAQLQNAVAVLIGITPLFVFLSKIVSFPISTSSVLYQKEANVERIVIATAIALLFISSIFTMPYFLAVISLGFALFSIPNAELKRKLAKKGCMKEIMKGTLIGAVATLSVIIVTLLSDKLVYMLLLTTTSMFVEWVYLKRIEKSRRKKKVVI